jgi:hypothetical protein
MATTAILNFVQPPKVATHYGGYSYKISWSLMKGIQKSFKSPLFGFHGSCGTIHGNQGAKHVKFTPDSNNFAVMFPVTSTFSGTR